MKHSAYDWDMVATPQLTDSRYLPSGGPSDSSKIELDAYLAIL